MDFVVEINKMPLPGETILGKSFSLVPGGKGANQAYAIGKLGANVVMLGAIGNDQYGNKLLENLSSANVNIKNIIKLNNENTGCAFINVDENGENSIIVISGANGKITADIINNNIELIDKADIIVMQLEIPIKIVELIAKIAKEKGKTIILDPAPAVPNLNESLLTNIDIIKPNETEIQILTGIKITSEEDIIKAGKLLISKGVKNVIVTLGESGSILITNENVKYFSSPKVNVVDTTAAGDSFTAGLVKSLSENKSIDESIKFGHIVAALAVTKKGAQTSIPDMIEIKNFLMKGNNI